MTIDKPTKNCELNDLLTSLSHDMLWARLDLQIKFTNIVYKLTSHQLIILSFLSAHLICVTSVCKQSL